MFNKTMIAATLGGALALSACTEPGAYDPNDPNRNTRQGALAGAAAGALIGAATGEGSRRDEILTGAVVGGAVGAGIGYSLDRQARELQDSFSNGDIAVINTGDELIVRMPNAILFPVDSSTVNAQLRSDLGVLANSLNRYPSSVVAVVGHTDNTGAAAYNQGLSEDRARAVASVLQGNGVASNRLRVFGAGEDQPIASNATEAGRAQNRRVEITITPTG